MVKKCKLILDVRQDLHFVTSRKDTKRIVEVYDYQDKGGEWNN